MSGLFDSIFHALGRPAFDRVGQEEQDASSDGLIVQGDIGQVSHHRQTHTAPSTPNVSRLSITADQSPKSVASRHTDPSSGSHPAATPDASFSSGVQGTASTMSTPADIQMCPQPTPFVYRRRALTNGHDESPIKAVHFNPSHFRQNSTPANVHIRPEILEVAQPPSEASVEVKPEGMCSWRQEQLANMRPAKLTNDGKVKVLSSLHGPLSLPYARNPSGVDATVPDHSTYYGNTFGLRAVPRYGDSDRVVSGGTDKTQSSSGSSVLLLDNRHKHFSDSEKGQLSNMVIKDPYQRFAATKSTDKGEHRQPALPEAMSARKARDDYEGPVKSTLNPTSSPFSTRAMVHRALGVRPNPTDAEPFKPLADSAFIRASGDSDHEVAQYDDATIARLINTARYYGLELRRASDKSSVGSRIPSNDSSNMSSGNSRILVTPQHLSLGISSKADVSANWRAKGKGQEPHGDDQQGARPESPPAPIMTIDELMEKFSSPPSNKGNEKAIKVKVPAPAELVPVPVSKPKTKVVAAVSTPTKSKSPLGERSTNTDPETGAKTVDAKKTAPKGTPGAGRLLKKSHGSSAASKASNSAKAAAKLVPINEQVAEGVSID